MAGIPIGRSAAGPSNVTQPLRLAELMAALSLATDLGMGQPLEQALRTCLIAIELADRVGLTKDEISEVFYVALLRFLGCTADAHEVAEIFGGDDLTERRESAPHIGGSPSELGRFILRVGHGHGPLRRAQLFAGLIASGPRSMRDVARAHCEMAEHLAVRLGLPEGVRRALGNEYWRWDGLAAPRGFARNEIPISARIVFLARDAEVLHREGGSQLLRVSLRARSGHAYDPAVAGTLLQHADAVMAAIEVTSPWGAVLDREPEPRPWVPESRLDSVLETFADFVDMKSPWMAGHSRGVAALAGGASAAGKDLRRSGLVHDLGRVGVPNGIWDKPGPLTDGEWERVRLHPYYSERILERSATLSPLAVCAGMHHERLDGSGYHRRAHRAEVSRDARILAAADAYQAMTQPRAFRQAHSTARAAEELEAEVQAGRLDADAVHSVLTVAGHRPHRTTGWPAGLSDREVEVLRLLCRGGTKKEVARLLTISPRTVDHHVRHIYDKVGVATRAGATLFAAENDLLA
jgi:HD-GYP domain-containing protein (c-di-GMP phosphodiesterase class II)/DNA-binding CsgD family transcriptional regulator